jgi:hypothetical protein
MGGIHEEDRPLTRLRFRQARLHFLFEVSGLFHATKCDPLAAYLV